MHVRYQTRNSVWEVEWRMGLAVRARRLSGLVEVTYRTPEDGSWRAVEEVVDLPSNAGLWIQWEGLERGLGTWTSEIMERAVVTNEVSTREV